VRDADTRETDQNERHFVQWTVYVIAVCILVVTCWLARGGMFVRLPHPERRSVAGADRDTYTRFWLAWADANRDAWNSTLASDLARYEQWLSALASLLQRVLEAEQYAAAANARSGGVTTSPKPQIVPITFRGPLVRRHDSKEPHLPLDLRNPEDARVQLTYNREMRHYEVEGSGRVVPAVPDTSARANAIAVAGVHQQSAERISKILQTVDELKRQRETMMIDSFVQSVIRESVN
jgi:hypothetical protein